MTRKSIMGQIESGERARLIPVVPLQSAESAGFRAALRPDCSAPGGAMQDARPEPSDSPPDLGARGLLRVAQVAIMAI